MRAQLTVLLRLQIRTARFQSMSSAVGRSTPMDVTRSIPGDSRAKQQFYTLLPDFAKRLVFLDVLSDARAYPRVRSIFGAPPFSFLKAEDAEMLRAGGFAHARQHMSYGATEGLTIPPYSQFGISHLRDQYDREYTICRQDATDSMTIRDACLLGGVGPTNLFIRIKRVDAKQRSEFEKSPAQRRRLCFPSTGENLVLRPSVELLRLLHLEGEVEALTRNARVLGVRLPNKRASTTSLTVLVTEM